MFNTTSYISALEFYLHLCNSNPEATMAEGECSKSIRRICTLDATKIFCLCIRFPNAKVSSSTEKSHGNGLDCLGGVDVSCISALVINLPSVFRVS